MPQDITEIDSLQQYVAGVMGRADHHAGDVKAIALTVAGAIIWKKDSDQPIKVLAKDSELWVAIGGERYTFSYNHTAGAIEMRKGSTQGVVIKSFTNTSSIIDVWQSFNGL